MSGPGQGAPSRWKEQSNLSSLRQAESDIDEVLTPTLASVPTTALSAKASPSASASSAVSASLAAAAAVAPVPVSSAHSMSSRGRTAAVTMTTADDDEEEEDEDDEEEEDTSKQQLSVAPPDNRTLGFKSTTFSQALEAKKKKDMEDEEVRTHFTRLLERARVCVPFVSSQNPEQRPLVAQARDFLTRAVEKLEANVDLAKQRLGENIVSTLSVAASVPEVAPALGAFIAAAPHRLDVTAPGGAKVASPVSVSLESSRNELTSNNHEAASASVSAADTSISPSNRQQLSRMSSTVTRDYSSPRLGARSLNMKSRALDSKEQSLPTANPSAAWAEFAAAQQSSTNTDQQDALAGKTASFPENSTKFDPLAQGKTPPQKIRQLHEAKDAAREGISVFDTAPIHPRTEQESDKPAFLRPLKAKGSGVTVDFDSPGTTKRRLTRSALSPLPSSGPSALSAPSRSGAGARASFVFDPQGEDAPSSPVVAQVRAISRGDVPMPSLMQVVQLQEDLIDEPAISLNEFASSIEPLKQIIKKSETPVVASRELDRKQSRERDRERARIRSAADATPSSPHEISAMRLSDLTKVDMEHHQAASAFERQQSELTPKPGFLRKIDLEGKKDGSPSARSSPADISPSRATQTDLQDQTDISNLLKRVELSLPYIGYIDATVLQQVTVLLQLSVEKLETIKKVSSGALPTRSSISAGNPASGRILPWSQQ